jgi:hypothetical protein
VQKGDVRRAPTWHKDDFAVELVGDDVVISQFSDERSSSCIQFDMVADIESNARLTLDLDFYDDGVIDYSQEIGHVRWQNLLYFLSTPRHWEGVRFTLRKTGPGRVRLAQIEAKEGFDCPPGTLELRDRPLGGACFEDAECASGYCAPEALSVCTTDSRLCNTNQDCPSIDGEPYPQCIALRFEPGTCQ